MTGTNDGGASWSLVHDFNAPVTMVASSLTDPSTLYAAVVDTEQGGIYVSRDAHLGERSSWNKMPAPPRTVGHPWNIHALKDGSLVATFSCSQVDNVFTPSSGVFYLAPNGKEWEDRSHERMLRWTKDLTLDPNDKTESTWYVGVFNNWGAYETQLRGGLFRTTDRGATWTELTPWPGVERVDSCSVSTTEPNLVFCTTDGDGCVRMPRMQPNNHTAVYYLDCVSE